MALKPCRECKREVAVGAKTCPHCGISAPAPSSAQVMSSAGCALTLLVTVPIVIIGILMLTCR